MNKLKSIPKSFDEMTYSQMIKLVEWDGLTFAELIQSWSGLDFDEALNYYDSIAPNVFDWLFTEKLFDRLNKLNCPNKIEINGKSVKVPNDLRIESFGKKMMINNIQLSINQSDDSSLALLKSIPKAVAVYLCDKYFGHFDSSKIDELELLINDLPAVKVYPIGMFFFRKLRTLTDIRKND